MPTVRREEDEGGRAVAVKTAAEAGDGERLRAEARALATLAHPGVVELVGVTGEGEATELRTAWVDGPSLATVGPFSAEEVAGLAASLADTLAHIHRAGWVHAALTPDHVLLDRSGRPVLCGFGWAAPKASIPERPPDPFWPLDPAREPSSPLDSSFDVFALGTLVARLLDPVPARSDAGLRSVAEAACDPEPWRRPSAAALAAALASAVPGARLPAPGREERAVAGPASRPAARARPGARARATSPLGGPDEAAGALARLRADARRADRPRRAERPQRERKRSALVAAAAVLAVAALGLVLLGRGSEPRGSSQAAPPTAVTDSAAAASTVGAGCPPPSSAGLAGDLDGDGCEESLVYAAGVLDDGRRRWAAGNAGDLAAVGDWDCDGRDTLVLVRPSTGQVFRFDRVAGPRDTVVAVEAGHVPNPLQADAVDADADGCDELAVLQRDGGEAVLALRPEDGS